MSEAHNTVRNDALYRRLERHELRQYFRRGVGFGAGFVIGIMLVLAGSRLVVWMINTFLGAF